MNSIIVKQSPIILIRTFVLIELAALCIYLLATIFDEYKLQIYAFLPLSRISSYEAFKFPFLSGIQVIIFIYAFLRWYRDYYSVGPGSLTHFWGAFHTKPKQKNLDLNQSTLFTVQKGPIGKLNWFHYGSIEVSNGSGKNDKIIVRNIPHPQNFKEILEEAARENDPAELLKREENERLEFKSTLRFDQKSGLVNRELEKTAMKTIAAFLNSKGGQLVLGINDSREIVGLASDYRTLYRPSNDGFENHFTQIFNSMIGPEFRHLIKLSFHKIDGQETCLVQAMPSPRPVYLKIDDGEHFYVRTGNVSTPLKLSEIELYSRSRWSRRVLSA